jgi:glycosyltransferase involved in cell wall biosynthesis
MQSSVSFSVIIPLYNKENYIARAVRSVLAQDWDDYELLVVDDGSTDGGARLVDRQFHDLRLRLIRQRNAGEGAARNRGLAEMTGSLAAFLDADDEWLPNHLSDLADLAVRFPEADWFATGYRSVFRGGFATDTTLSEPKAQLVENYFEAGTGAHFVHISSIAVRKGALDDVGRFQPREPVGADLEFYGRLALAHRLAYQPAVSGIYHHQIPGSAMSTARWNCEPPPVVRTLDARDDSVLPAALRGAARRYADWVFGQHILAGLCAGQRQQAVSLLARRGTRPGWSIRVAKTVPPSALGWMVRVCRSRWLMGKERRYGRVLVRRAHPPIG